MAAPCQLCSAPLLPNKTTTWASLCLSSRASTITATHGWPQSYQLFAGTVNLFGAVWFFFTTDLRPAVLSLSIKDRTLQDARGKQACHYNDNISQMIAFLIIVVHCFTALVWVFLSFSSFEFFSFFLLNVTLAWKLLKKDFSSFLIMLRICLEL